MNLVFNRLYLSISCLIILFCGFFYYSATIGNHVYSIEKYERAARNWNRTDCLDWFGGISTTRSNCHDLSYFTVKTAIPEEIGKFILYNGLTILALVFLKKWFLWAFNIGRDNSLSNKESTKDPDDVSNAS